jgi:peptide-methionine (S)-S-oxide reductase
MEKATFGGGCFWGVEAALRNVPGVRKTTVGYMGGVVPNPSYQEVCSDRTGHAEVVRVVYDPSVVSYEQLLEVFWELHDPTMINRQGDDVGTQYRSVIFFHDESQEKKAAAARSALDRSGRFARPVATHVLPAKPFYAAEERHQRYYEKHPEARGSCGAAGCRLGE